MTQDELLAEMDECTDPAPLDYENILTDVYGNGRYQICLLIITSTACFIAGAEYQSMIFTDYGANFSCQVSNLGPITNDVQVKWISREDYQNYNSAESGPTNESWMKVLPSTEQCYGLIKNSTTIETIACTVWDFYPTQMQRTIVMDLELICQKAYLIPIMKSLYVGSAAIGMLTASITDRIGRRTAVLFYASYTSLTSIAMPFANSLPTFIILRCLRGLSSGESYVSLSLLNEIVPANRRALYGNVFWLSWSFGYMTAAGVAYAEPDWSKMKLWTCFALLPYVLLPFLVVESPRWLSVRGRLDEAFSNIRRIARFNRVNLAEDRLTRIRDYIFVHRNVPQLHHSTDADRMTGIGIGSERSERQTLCKALTSRVLCSRIVTFYLVQCAISLVYGFVTAQSAFASSNIFLNVFLLGLFELPSGPLSWLMADYFGRRSSIIITLLLTLFCLILVQLVKLTIWWLQLISGSLAKLSISTAFCVSDLIMMELLPTRIRTTGLLSVLTFANFISSASPLIIKLTDKGAWIPTGIFCAVTFIGTLLVYLRYPETKAHPLPQTIRQAEEIKRDLKCKIPSSCKRQ